MSASLNRAMALAIAILVPTLAALPQRAASASPITYDFTVTVTSGPLAGQSPSGSFTFDSSSVVPGGFNNATNLLTALSFTFNGTAYTAATANTGALGFNAAGALTVFGFGTNCGAGLCSVTGNTNQFFVSHFGFTYSQVGTNNFFRGTVAFSPAQVPEPGTLALLGAGLLGLGLARRRSRAAAPTIA